MDPKQSTHQTHVLTTHAHPADRPDPQPETRDLDGLDDLFPHITNADLTPLSKEDMRAVTAVLNSEKAFDPNVLGVLL